MKQKKVIRYSEAFKRQVVQEMEAGKFESVCGAQRAYGIKGAETLRKWIVKYGSENLLPKRIRVEKMKEIDELKESRKRIRQLEAALADAHIDNCLEQAFLEIACGRMDMNVEDFKKRNELKLSDLRKRRGKTGE